MKSSLKDIEYLVGDRNFKNTISIPYNEKICEFISIFSKELLTHKQSSEFPDLKPSVFGVEKKIF